MALLGAGELGVPFGYLYAEAISIAIVTRLLDTATRSSPADRPRAAPLASWRLKRAVDYIDANLSDTLSLGELAAVVGLTRMHFAAQFRSATGLRPREYLLRRRVERAQELLRHSRATVMNVALRVGFQDQSHFTATFKRFVGQPPHAWRTTQAK
jgi:transcriptional regulator GlxA family with amidase domain